MSTYDYSFYINDTIDFDPAKDVLYVDSDSPAAYFGFEDLADGSGVRFGLANHTLSLVLSGVTADALTSDNVVFQNGVFLTPSLSNNYASSLTGAASADLLIGGNAPRELARVSLGESGAQASGYSANANVSANGRFVVFESDATDLTADADGNGVNDIFVKDLLTGSVTRISESAAGAAGNNTATGSTNAAISADGHFAIFSSNATNLVANDTNGKTDLFLKDLWTGAISRISTSTAGVQSNQGVDHDYSTSVSADGRYVSFASNATNLVSGDTNGLRDIFLNDTLTGQLTRVSTSSGGAQADGNSYDARLDAWGNALANYMKGNAMPNFLDGSAGADTMAGGIGDDTYVVDSGGDRIMELAGEGYDLVQSSISFVLGDTLEDLTLTGAADLAGTGNASINTLRGNAGSNRLDGGLGSDYFSGGAGSDTFVLRDLASDSIEDFVHGIDKILLDQTGVRIGDGDSAVEGAVEVTGPGGFSTGAEVVVITQAVSGERTIDSAAAAIGSASGHYAVGDTRLFVVHSTDGTTGLLRFQAADADGVVEWEELQWLVTLFDSSGFSATDLVFGT
jgi:Ca2+-binding RTX toxin-like protein